MKNKIYFLITLIAIIMSININVYAKEKGFYEGEYIDNIYMNKIMSNDPSTIYYQKARFFRDKETNEFVYCIEPQAFFNENSNYSEVTPPLNDINIQMIKAYAYYGYNYPGHEDKKWYAITQLLIWQAADPTGKFYFTNGLNGNRIDIYQNEINELKNLVNKHYTRPNLTELPRTLEEKNYIEVNDLNSVISNYNTNIGTIEGNKLILKDLKEGTYNIVLTRVSNKYNKDIKIYESINSQNLITQGNLEDIVASKKIYVKKTNLTINKIDENTNSNKTTGEAKIEGTIIEISNSNSIIKKIKLDDTGTYSIDNLPFGKYKIKETKPGEGYNINDSEYEITIDYNNPNAIVEIKNKVIEQNITIHKTYGDEKELLDEENISFDIYNSNNELVDTITTDSKGIANIILPYGNYYIKQVNTKEGYKYVDPIELNVNTNDSISLELKDIKIPEKKPIINNEKTIVIEVPNTYKKSLIEIIINILKDLIYDKKYN
ncbi:MAG: Cys-Gln thioester bond-forming surface protein [Bacilli bacterium]|nr:Cys-Gln thioester bond-forming surface protein [Bacilli bacterium]